MHRPNGSYNSGNFPRDPSQRRRPSETGSAYSSRAASVANSRSSDGTISDQQSRRYKRMEMELQQHYTVLRAYLRGGAAQPPRPNKARDKLLRLSPVQFHELSTDVFDELQRRQASAPLPGRGPGRENVPPFLQPRSDFHEKRNQARQKLSSLQIARFRDLSTDVFCELERRFPTFGRSDGGHRDSSRSQSRGPPNRMPVGNGYHSGPNGFMPPARAQTQGVSIASNNVGLPPRSASALDGESPPGPNGSDYGRPMAKQFQSNTIVPTKSTMVEDEDEAQGVESASRYERSSDAFGLESALTSPHSDINTSMTSQSMASSNRDMKPPMRPGTMQDKIEALEAALKARDDEIRHLQINDGVDKQWADTKQDLENKLEDTERLNQSMKDELERLQVDQANMEHGLRAQIEEARSGAEHDGMWQSKHDQLLEEHTMLQEKLVQQRKITDEVRQEAESWLIEMRAMAEGGGGNLEREEKLHAEVQRLEEEVKEWKARYAKAKAQLRSTRAGSLGLSIAMPDAARYVKDGTFFAEDGIIRDIHIAKFQISIDELLRVARCGELSAVLDYMKPVVEAVRNIAQDLDQSEVSTKDEDVVKERSKLKSKISATANNVITACRNFAAAGGLAPISLLDAAASHLTMAVVELVRAVKIRPTPTSELEDDAGEDIDAVPQDVYFKVTQSLRRSGAHDSIYSALSTPNRVPDGQDGPGPSFDGQDEDYSTNGHNGLGVKAGYGPREDEASLEELKVRLIAHHSARN